MAQSMTSRKDWRMAFALQWLLLIIIHNYTKTQSIFTSFWFTIFIINILGSCNLITWMFEEFLVTIFSILCWGTSIISWILVLIISWGNWLWWCNCEFCWNILDLIIVSWPLRHWPHARSFLSITYKNLWKWKSTIILKNIREIFSNKKSQEFHKLNKNEVIYSELWEMYLLKKNINKALNND